jgi:hypothetical protein
MSDPETSVADNAAQAVGGVSIALFFLAFFVCCYGLRRRRR